MQKGVLSLALAAPVLAPVLAIATVAMASTDRSPPRGAEPENPFAQQLLDRHNTERDRVGVPHLSWNDRLAREARQWAARLAQEGQIRHSTYNERNGAGENLWMGSKGYYSPDSMISAFAEERRHYLHGTFPQVSRTGQWSDVGHYTQMIWRDTQQVGCAVVQGAQHDFLVCRYWPAGNFYGQRAY